MLHIYFENGLHLSKTDSAYRVSLRGGPRIVHHMQISIPPEPAVRAVVRLTPYKDIVSDFVGARGEALENVLGLIQWEAQSTLFHQLSMFLRIAGASLQIMVSVPPARLMTDLRASPNHSCALTQMRRRASPSGGGALRIPCIRHAAATRPGYFWFHSMGFSTSTVSTAPPLRCTCSARRVPSCSLARWVRLPVHPSFYSGEIWVTLTASSKVRSTTSCILVRTLRTSTPPTQIARCQSTAG